MCYEWAQLTASTGARSNENGTATTARSSSWKRQQQLGFVLTSILLINIRDSALFAASLVAAMAFVSVAWFEVPAAGQRQEDGNINTKKNVNGGSTAHFPGAGCSSAAIDSFVTGLLLITVPCRAWLLLVSSSSSGASSNLACFRHVVSLLLVVWNADTGALVSGRLVRSVHIKRRYYYSGRQNSGVGGGTDGAIVGFGSESPEWLRRISPKKSLAGVLGGVVTGTITFLLLPLFWKFVEMHNLIPTMSTAMMTDTDTFRTTTTRTFVPIDNFQEDDRDLYSLLDGENDHRRHYQLSMITDYDLYAKTSPAHDEHDRKAWMDAIAVGLYLSVLAALGDLWVSSQKRKYGAKDFSRLLPGHGGVLDRFDSSLLAVLLYQYYVERGVL